MFNLVLSKYFVCEAGFLFCFVLFWSNDLKMQSGSKMTEYPAMTGIRQALPRGIQG